MHCDVPGEAGDALDDVEQGLELSGIETAVGELRQTRQRASHVLRACVGEAAGDRVELVTRDAEHLADLADGHLGLEGLHHRDTRRAVFTEPGHHQVVDVLAAMGLDVQVDVGQLVAVGVHEPFEGEPVRHRVHVADPQRETHARR